MRKLAPKNVLEVGIGEGVVAEYLKGSGIELTTLDIDASLAPDIVGDVRKIPLPDGSVDAVLAAEILEHMPFDDAREALKEMRRVARTGAVISAPAPGWVFSFRLKIPLLKGEGITKVPFFWKTYQYDPNEAGVHHWELGYRGIPEARLLQAIKEAGFTVATARTYQDDPSHRFYVLKVA